MNQAAAPTVPPEQIMMTHLLGVPVSHMIGLAAELGIPTLLEVGPKHVEEVAQRCATLPDPTYRLLRGLSAVGVLAESAEGVFALTPLGQCLLPSKPGSFHALAQMNNAAWITSSYALLRHSLTTGQAAFEKHHGESLFDYLAHHPVEQQMFGQAMSTFSGMEVDLVLGAYDFSTLRSVVDVGGGHGLLLSRVLAAAKSTKGTLFDRPDVVEQAKLSFIDAKLAARCEVVGGDFFQSVPPGGDVYLLKHILHDWDDERATQILRCVADAMQPGARVLVIEQGIAPPGVPNPGKVMDVIMLMLLGGGRERTPEQHAALMQRVGIRFEREIATPGPITLFEGVRG